MCCTVSYSYNIKMDMCFLLFQGKFVSASTERDVFSILKLNYLEPWERNC